MYRRNDYAVTDGDNDTAKHDVNESTRLGNYVDRNRRKFSKDLKRFQKLKN